MFYLCSQDAYHSAYPAGLVTTSSCLPEDPSPPPKDDPFLERLFGVMCAHIPARKGETFVDQVRHWYGALRCMADLQPDTRAELLLAADVTMKNQFAMDVLARGKGPAGRQRQQQSREFIIRAQELHDAQLQYELLKSRRET